MADQILIEEGRKIISALLSSRNKIAFAVWYLDPLSQTTYLGIGSETFDQLGPSKSYEEILKVVDGLKDQLTLFKADYLKLISLESDLGRVFSSSFTNKKGDTSIGMFVSPTVILHQVYAYGIQSA